VKDAITLSDSPRGYVRSDELQTRFIHAADRLRLSDGWPDPARDGERVLRADLALEGGGVKGVGLVGAVLVLDEAGYSIRRVAGTSAGAIAASVIAGIVQTGSDMTILRRCVRTLDFTKFMPDGRLHELLDHAGGRVAELVADAAILTNREGLYSGDYLESWLAPILHEELGVRTFADLKLAPDFDPDLDATAAQRYRLVVNASDITRGRLTRLPWDYPTYGHDPDAQDPVSAVRASMSIPFFFEPVHVDARDATLDVRLPGGEVGTVHFGGGPHTWVDGAMLAKYPLHIFDRTDGRPSRWPTLGIKLSRYQTDYAVGHHRESALAIAVRCLKTMMNGWDSSLDHESRSDRTIYVDGGRFSPMDFDITSEQQDELFLNGVLAATRYVIDAADAREVGERSDAA
jgi:NTE family protein